MHKGSTPIRTRPTSRVLVREARRRVALRGGTRHLDRGVLRLEVPALPGPLS